MAEINFNTVILILLNFFQVTIMLTTFPSWFHQNILARRGVQGAVIYENFNPTCL